jgi:hypothetical protein
MICACTHHPFQPLLQRKLLKPRGGILKWLSKNGAVAAENDGSGVDWGATCGHLPCFFEACLLRDYRHCVPTTGSEVYSAQL